MVSSPSLSSLVAQIELIEGENHCCSVDADCQFCIFQMRDSYSQMMRYGEILPSKDIHCGYYDRRVTPVMGCGRFIRDIQ